MNRESHACPPWCVAVHSAEDEPGVVRHRSRIVDVGVLTPSAATVLMLELHRVEGEAITWVYVGDGEKQFLELSLESAVRVARAIELAVAS